MIAAYLNLAGILRIEYRAVNGGNKQAAFRVAPGANQLYLQRQGNFFRIWYRNSNAGSYTLATQYLLAMPSCAEVGMATFGNGLIGQVTAVFDQVEFIESFASPGGGDNLATVGIPGNRSFKVYPNPADGQVRVILADAQPVDRTLYVYDLTGRHCASYQVPAGQYNLTIDTGQLAKGVYCLYLEAAGPPKLLTKH